MSTTILTDEQIDATLESLDCLFWDVSEGATHDFARAIEQAVLQSEQVQARMEAYAAEKVREALESLQWISVADRLPDERERVLAFGRIRSTNLGPGKLGISVAWRIADRYFTDGASNVFGEMLCVTHWMPLPAPPLPGPVEP